MLSTQHCFIFSRLKDHNAVLETRKMLHYQLLNFFALKDCQDKHLQVELGRHRGTYHSELRDYFNFESDYYL